jgi:hypothetical protein
MENNTTMKTKSEIRNEVAEMFTSVTGVTFRAYASGLMAETDALKLEIASSRKTKELCVRLWAGPKGFLTTSRYEDFYNDSPNQELWKNPEEVCAGSHPDSISTLDPEFLFSLMEEAYNWALENQTPVQKQGDTFEGTNFEGYGERDFMAALVQIQKLGFAQVIPGVGTALGFEYQIPSVGGRIDAVEYNNEGQVSVVIEAQSGIQHGAFLDDEHFAKSISRYPNAFEIKSSVQKVVVIAGGYTEQQVETYKYMPFQVSLLKTVKEKDKISLVEVFAK